MSRLKKTKNILHYFRDRELNSGGEPYKSSLNIVSQLIRSDKNHYNYSWHEKSSKPITYDFGNLYFNNHTSTYTVYGNACKPSKSRTFKPRKAKKKIVDVITYNTPVPRTFENCKCKHKCSCASRFILCLTEDNFLCQYNMITGELISEVFVKRINSNFKFKYCDWDEYATSVILTSQLNCSDVLHSSKSDVVVNLAVFSVFPVEFTALFEINRSVFGKGCKHVNVADQLLILGMGYDRVHIYSFLEVMAQGDLTPYKIGEKYSDLGEIGLYPTGLPLNFHVLSAPPLLFDVQCFGQSVCFGGYPYHCIYPDPKDHLRFIIQNMKGDGTQNSFIESNVWNDEPNIVTFYPDNSNRIISRELLRVRVYDLKYENGELKLDESHCMEFQDSKEKKMVPKFNTFGRRINRSNHSAWSFLSDRCIMATDFENELDLFGILGVCPTDPEQIGFVKLYDSLTGKEVKSIKLRQSLCETNYYQLHIDWEIFIVIERDSRNIFNVYVYQIAEKDVN